MEEPHAKLLGRAVWGWSAKRRNGFVYCVSNNASLGPAEDLSKGRYALIIHCLVLKCCFSPGRIKLNSSGSQDDLQQGAVSKKKRRKDRPLDVFCNNHKPDIDVVLWKLNGNAHNLLG